MDYFFTAEGDIKLSPSGDIALTGSDWRQDAQDAYVRIKTEPGDFVLYPELGADLTRLYGMPQSEATAEFGKQIIKEALDREGRFIGKPLILKAAPTGPQSIRFDVFVISGSRSNLILSIEENLGIE